MCAGQSQPALRGPRIVHEPLSATEQVGAGDRLSHVLQARDRAAVKHSTSGLARTRADIDDPICSSYDVEVVLHDEQCVAGRLEAVQDIQQRLRVGRVQAGEGLVQDVDDSEQTRTQLGGDPQALRLSGRQRRRAPSQAEITQAQIEEHLDARDQVSADPRRDLVGTRGPLSDRTQQSHQRCEGQVVDLGDRTPEKGHREGLGP